MIKGREGKGATSTDLLVCFPTRAHLTLMPKPICSPSRPSEPNKRHHSHHHHIHRLKKAGNRGGGGAVQASPLSWAKNKQMGSDISEPTSPKVTCAGQIKVRPKPTSSCRNWQSVMEEIERLHNNNKKHKVKKPSWVEALGIKKDVMQFLTCLRSIRFDFRCFGAFPTSDIITSDDDEEEEEDEEDDPDNQVHDNGDETSRTFSKWFMVLQDNQNGVNKKEDSKGRDNMSYGEESVSSEPCAPPSNALLLMRCRSAPAKSWLEEREEEEDDDEVDESEEREKEEEEERKKKENMVVMRYDTNLYKFSTEIAKETWVVGGMRDTLSRSRSWKR